MVGYIGLALAAGSMWYLAGPGVGVLLIGLGMVVIGIFRWVERIM
jgi:hypothetical protein